MKQLFLICTLLPFSKIMAEPVVDQLLTPSIVSLKQTSGLPLSIGDKLTAFRSVAASSMTAVTAELKIIAFMQDEALAQIVTDGSTESRALFAKFPSVMAGDSVRLPDLVISHVQQALPDLNFSFRELFQDAKPSPVSFDLSESGLASLAAEISPFLNAKVPRIIVEAYVDESLNADVSLLESQLRAKAVRQTLIDQFHIEPGRIIALGFGEMEPAIDRITPQVKDLNRRIVIRFQAD